MKRNKQIVLPDDSLPDGFHADVILVFGAGLRSDGEPSNMLRDRVVTGALRYLAGDGDLLLMSGAVHTGGYDEPEAMKRYAVSHFSVEPGKVLTDKRGVSTYESIRGLRTFGAKRVLLISQGYHLPRALDLARQMGYNAYAVAADLNRYRDLPKCRVREWFARIKDFCRVRFLR